MSDEKLHPQTGPITEEGKATSAKNSTQHGMRQVKFALLPDEDEAEFNAFAHRWRMQYAKALKQNPALVDLLREVAELEWLQRRCRNRLNRLEAQLFTAEADENDPLIEKLEARIKNAYRYKTAAENSFARALRTLEQFQRVRVREEQEWTRLDIAGFKATEAAAVKRFVEDIPESRRKEIPAFWHPKYNEFERLEKSRLKKKGDGAKTRWILKRQQIRQRG